MCSRSSQSLYRAHRQHLLHRRLLRQLTPATYFHSSRFLFRARRQHLLHRRLLPQLPPVMCSRSLQSRRPVLRLCRLRRRSLQCRLRRPRLRMTFCHSLRFRLCRVLFRLLLRVPFRMQEVQMTCLHSSLCRARLRVLPQTIFLHSSLSLCPAPHLLTRSAV